MAKVNFRTNVLLKSIIGKDLITDDNIAVLELVKNSFDAGSNKVEIEFKNLIINIDSLLGDSIKDTPQLIISDLGKGMSEYDLVNKLLGHLTQPLRGDPAVLPEAVVHRVRGTDDVTKAGQPPVCGKVLGVSMT